MKNKIKEITQCQQCNGIGKLFLRNGKTIKCDMCEGTGQHEENLLWTIQGLKLCEWRMENKLTLRMAAKTHGIDPSNLSKMERGILKPYSSLLKLALEK